MRKGSPLLAVRARHEESRIPAKARSLIVVILLPQVSAWFFRRAAFVMLLDRVRGWSWDKNSSCCGTFWAETTPTAEFGVQTTAGRMHVDTVSSAKEQHAQSQAPSPT